MWRQELRGTVLAAGGTPLANGSAVAAIEGAAVADIVGHEVTKPKR